MKFNTYKGTLNLLGNANVNVNFQNKGYSLIELIDDQKIISLRKILISLNLDNYLLLGEEIEIKTITIPVIGFLNAEIVYAIYSKERGLNFEVPTAMKAECWFYCLIGIIFLSSSLLAIFSLFFFYMFFSRKKTIKFLKNDFEKNYKTSLI